MALVHCHFFSQTLGQITALSALLPEPGPDGEGTLFFRPQDVVLPLEAPVALKSPGQFEFKIRRVMIPLARVIDRFERIRL